MAHTSIMVLKKQLAKVRLRQYEYQQQLSNFNNVTHRRPITINIQLDALANREKKILEQIKGMGWVVDGFGDRFIGRRFTPKYD